MHIGLGDQPYHFHLIDCFFLWLTISFFSYDCTHKYDMWYTLVGFNPSDFDNIITSGDVSHSLLQNNANSLGCN